MKKRFNYNLEGRQILIVTTGFGWYQEEGKSAIFLKSKA